MGSPDEDHHDDGDRDLMRERTAQAQALANSTGDTVEIYTADGIVADAVTPE